jgi:hypothetical protein
MERKLAELDIDGLIAAAKKSAAYLQAMEEPSAEKKALGKKVFEANGTTKLLLQMWRQMPLIVDAQIAVWLLPVLKQIKAAQVDIAERPGMKYAGVFDRNKDYVRGDWCTFEGSSWHCNRPTKGGREPGSGDGTWTLAVKRGRDAKG